MKPLAVVMENVPDAMRFGDTNVFGEEIAVALDAEGYDTKYTSLNAVHFGIPQARERVVLIGLHRSLRATVQFPEPIHSHALPLNVRRMRRLAAA